MRVKTSDSKDNGSVDGVSTSSTSSESSENSEGEADNETIHADENSRSSSKGKGKAQPDSGKSTGSPEKKVDNSNEIGKLNNLVSTDMTNLVKGCDWPLLCELYEQ